MRSASDCAHCGLPLGRHPVAAAIDGVAAHFCCYGCALARQITRTGGEQGVAAGALVRLGLAVFFAMNAMMVSLPTYVPAIYEAQSAPLDGPLFQILRVLAMLLTAPVLFLLGGPILAGAWRAARTGGVNTDALIVVGTTAAYALSVVHVIEGRSEVYFDTVSMLLVLMTLGRYLDAKTRADAGEAIGRTLAAEPRPVERLRWAGDRRGLRIAPEALAAGDLVRIAAGEAFPADGVVVDGCGGVDQSLLTGEHRPHLLGPGDGVAGGASSLDGTFVVRLTAPVSESALARIEKMLTEARRTRTPAQRLADRIAAVMMPLSLAIAAAAGIGWALAAGADRGLLVGLAVLCVACPCGLGIATPVAVWTALRQATRRGIAVRDPAALEHLAAAKVVFFDKTGTLTQRQPRLESIDVLARGWSADLVLAVAAALERGQRHPLAHAIEAAAAASASARRLAAGGELGAAAEPEVSAVTVLPGRGIRARVGGRPTTLGSRALAEAELGVRLPAADPDATQVFLWQGGSAIAVLCLRESVRPEAAGALAALRQSGYSLALLTGDRQASAVVPSLIEPNAARLGLLPEEKLAALAAARGRGVVAMVGDGINDGPALAAADVGIAVASSTDLARVHAAVVLLADDLEALPWLAALARRTARVIRQNLAWSFAYNAVAVALAAAGLLSPIVSTLAMIGSSLIVVGNSRRLGRIAREPQPSCSS